MQFWECYFKSEYNRTHIESTLLLLYLFIILETLTTTVLIALDFNTYHIAQRIKWFHTDEIGLWGLACVCPCPGPSRENVLIFGLQTPSNHILQPYDWHVKLIALAQRIPAVTNLLRDDTCPWCCLTLLTSMLQRDIMRCHTTHITKTLKHPVDYESSRREFCLYEKVSGQVCGSRCIEIKTRI